MRLAFTCTLSLAIASGCASRTAPDVDTAGDTSSGDGSSTTNASGGSDSSSDSSTDGTGETDTSGQPPVYNRDVDILVVMDNSGSMGEEQATLSRSLDTLVGLLEAPDVQANYRIAVTTTDNGNPWCGTTSPEAGQFVYSSCRDRLSQFTNQFGDVDASAIACTEQCAFDNAALGIGAGSPPWLESVDGVTNLPDGVSAAEALRCVLPQGIDGCGFESQLESMNKALIRSATQTEPAFGFVREQAVLAVLLVTDEADCSSNWDWDTIFQSDGNKVFWHPESPNSPTSALCWYAGTSCVGAGNGFYDCSSANYDVNGSWIDPDDPSVDDLAVLFPLSRFSQRLQALEDEKKSIYPDREVVVGMLGGFTDNGEAVYTDAADPEFGISFGVGPGCVGEAPGATPCQNDGDCFGIDAGSCGESGYCMETQEAVPPVRMREFGEAFSDDLKFSICADDYKPAMASFVDAIAQQF